MPSIRLDITKKYKNGFTLGPIEFDLPRGITAIVGANGAGKSTLFRIIAGFDTAFQGAGVTGADQLRVGYLPQDMSFPGSAKCSEYLHHVAWLYRVPKLDRAQAVSDVLERVGLCDKRDAKIRELSGGMRRRLGFAHAILHDPELLILDEPTAGLDPVQRKELRRVIQRDGARRVTLISTHLIDDVVDISDRVVILRNGTAVFIGTQQELLATNGASERNLEEAIVRYMSPTEVTA